MMRLKQNIKKNASKINAFKEKERKKSIERIARDDALARVERDDAQEETYVISFISLFAPFWGPREWLKNYSRRRLAQFGILEFYRLSLYLETLSLSCACANLFKTSRARNCPRSITSKPRGCAQLSGDAL